MGWHPQNVLQTSKNHAFISERNLVLLLSSKSVFIGFEFRWTLVGGSYKKYAVFAIDCLFGERINAAKTVDFGFETESQYPHHPNKNQTWIGIDN